MISRRTLPTTRKGAPIVFGLPALMANSYPLGAIVRNLPLFIWAAFIVVVVPIRAETVGDASRLQRQIGDAFEAGEKKFRIPAGTYRLSASSADVGACLQFSKMKDFEIDATDALLICEDRVSGLVHFDRCENVTWRGGTMRHDPVPFSQGTVEQVDPQAGTIDVRVSPGYPEDIEDVRYFPERRTKLLNVFDPSTRLRQPDVSDLYFTAARSLAPQIIRFSARLPLPPALLPGRLIAWRGGGRADVLLDRCSDMKILDLRIESGIGFCVHESGGGGGHYYRYTVTRGPAPSGAAEAPLFSCNADAFHSSNVRKGPTLEDCLFEHMNDDGIPIHGTFALVASDHEPVVASLNREFCQPGDRLRFYRPDGTPQGEGIVREVASLPSYQPAPGYEGRMRLFRERRDRLSFARLDRFPVAATSGWLVANLDALGSGFIVRRTTVRHTRARGILIKARQGLIEECLIEGTTKAGIALWPEMDVWSEADYACDVTIRNNTIRRVALWSDPRNAMAGAVSIGAETQRTYVRSPLGHARCTIEGNRFEHIDGVNLLLTSSEDISVRNNVFLEPMQEPSSRGADSLNPTSLIWITESRRISLEGNVILRPGPAMERPVVATPTVIDSRLDGIAVQAPWAPPQNKNGRP